MTYDSSFKFPSENTKKKGGILLPETVCTHINIRISQGDVKIEVLLGNTSRKGFSEDKKIADKIEGLIREAFKQYNVEKGKDAIDI